MQYYTYGNRTAPDQTYLFVWPTYRNDEWHLIESVKSVQHAMRKHPDKAIYVAMQDSLCPLSTEVIDILEGMGVNLWTTDYLRNGNNLGSEPLEGQTRTWVELAEKFDFDVLVKIDCDTQMWDAAWLWSIEDTPESVSLVGTFRACPYYVFGAAYGIKRAYLRSLAEDCRKFKAWKGSFEDYETGVRLYRISGGDLNYAVRYRVEIPDGFVLRPLEHGREDMHEARYVNLGWDYQTIPFEKKAEYKAKQLRMMKRLNELRFKADAEPATPEPETQE